jgi:ArsR family transcriptional regulator
MCRALGHPARLRILQHLKSAPCCCCSDIVRLLPLAQSTVSQHLKHLRDSGLIVGRSQGATTCYDLNRGLLEDLKRHLMTLL